MEQGKRLDVMRKLFAGAILPIVVGTGVAAIIALLTQSKKEEIQACKSSVEFGETVSAFDRFLSSLPHGARLSRGRVRIQIKRKGAIYDCQFSFNKLTERVLDLRRENAHR